MRFLIRSAVAAVFAAMIASGASAATILTGSGATNVDQFAGTSQDVVTAISGTVTDINISIELGGLGPQWGDIDMFLVHNGISVQLLDSDNPNDCCSSGDPFDVTFDDSAVMVLAQTGAVGAFQPQNGSLADFNGTDLAGTWTLQIFEVFCCVNETDLIAWSITAETGEVAVVPLPAGMPLVLSGIAMLGFTRLRRKKGVTRWRRKQKAS